MSDTTGSISLSDRTKHQPDYQLLVCIGIMVPFGLVMVYSASFVEGFVYYNDGLHYLLRQLFAAVVGTFGLLVASVPIIVGGVINHCDCLSSRWCCCL
jgi:cell division protein FtsW (lipid II flippase)